MHPLDDVNALSDHPGPPPTRGSDGESVFLAANVAGIHEQIVLHPVDELGDGPKTSSLFTSTSTATKSVTEIVFTERLSHHTLSRDDFVPTALRRERRPHT